MLPITTLGSLAGQRWYCRLISVRPGPMCPYRYDGQNPTSCLCPSGFARGSDNHHSTWNGFAVQVTQYSWADAFGANTQIMRIAKLKPIDLGIRLLPTLRRLLV